MTEVRFKRRRHITGAWMGDRLELSAPECGTSRSVDAGQVALLQACGDWTSAGEVAALLGRDLAEVRQGLEGLATDALLFRSDEERGSRSEALDGWGPWAPLASSFHLGTRDTEYLDPFRVSKPLFVQAPEPPPLKEYPDRPSVELPPFPTRGELAEALRGRRSWRTFGTGRATVEELSTLLGLTWAVQHWAVFEGVGRQALKTSPSGGARHSIEAYVGVRDVAGLEPGIYHYGPDTHALTLLREGFTAEDIAGLLPEQVMYGEASFLVVQTSLFRRVQWRYRSARAYRNIFIEAGHLAQTFLTVATHLGLAPFCTGALADTRIEETLGVDTLDESVLYVVGAGARPDAEWAPLPDGEQRGELLPPTYRSRLTEEND